MDWPSDNACLSRNGVMLRRIFKYSSRPSRVVRIVKKNQYRAEVWSLKSEEDWDAWLNKYSDQSDRGLILILADRTNNESPHSAGSCPMSIGDWLVEAEDSMPCKRGIRRETTFAPFEEKSHKGHEFQEATLTQEATSRRPRSLLNLPFSKSTFERICERFQVHDSIVRTLTRTDVPTFSCNNVEMGGPAYVYSCRTPNSWDSDLAMSATHHVQHGLTCAIIYGTTIKTEKAMLERLRNVRHEAAHPLLIPGILAEIELIRHTGLVDSMINDVEAKILELDMQTSKPRDHRQIDVERRYQSKRETWLNLSYLRNSIMTWKIQLLKIIEHANSLNTSPEASANAPTNVSHDVHCVKAAYGREYIQLGYPTLNRTSLEIPLFDRRPNELNFNNAHGPRHSWSHTQDSESFGMNKNYIGYPLQLHEREDGPDGNDHVRAVGEKIKVRLSAIIDDYDEKIRDCNMRVDGMAMATQWSQSETAVEIALATSQDSKVMRSISLVTMVFLPGTFFATVFSMTFFDWNDDKGKALVSKYLWIYVVVTVFFTAITIGLWYFFVMFRRSGPVKSDEEEMRWT
ncbi:hypothetical protein HBH56_017900 [Parastagonospora nodorum]|uniref:Uncharacterized protein n=2 Tax=Phaeosphaeria nodorum (strain SN15 / ATCC MYA-4574 / FGSC 10173) TaxID=321614 RepID=A0A7U2F0D8_PHANO|nr:hypothetical protein HBH56_017900 [Parastagonospora nodorum]QRC95223.1 hypothetical protein JI435_029240 [Parastagonospora nodorum SN15]KAH3937531.1 hypothetical protein HBH54_016600 [Parastagonospora nodorum]KAH3953886.1 hypothetical protein HBH53_028700 [Parastagonospora nodorum]KAH3962568.1 hypothetical protein HBH51_173040 [Parastagonospora nodorum]